MNWTHLMWHCSATPEGRHFDRKDIENWHIKGRGWSRVGYSGIVLLDGTLDILIPHDRDDSIDSWEISNGARGWNGKAKHFCYIGGTELINPKKAKDTRNIQQYKVMEAVTKLYIMLWPNIKVIGHNQVANKDCPSFYVPDFCEDIGIAKKNIDYKDYK